MRQKINEETYPFDKAAVQYSKLTDAEAKEQKQKVIDRIRANKNRSRFFRIDTLGPSMRRATRHPDDRGFKRNK